MANHSNSSSVGTVSRPILPEHVKPCELAKHLGVSERTVREIARGLGACRMIGREMILLPEDVKTFMEGIKQCPSLSKSVAGSGTTPELLPGGDYAALQARLKKPTRRGSRRKSNTSHGSVVSKDQGRA